MPVHTVLSPLPGTFYRRSSPDQAAFKEVGDPVAVGDTIGLIEVMKSFNPVTAEAAGKIAAFHVEDEDAVMPGQPLVDIDT
jgi:acetyl-CoA carboxylase biotin carboxyl carrier protein